MINIFNANSSPCGTQVTCVGDGASTTVTFDINKDPFNLPLFNHPPTQVMIQAFGPDGEITGVGAAISIDGSSHAIIVVTFPATFTANVALNLVFVYPTS